MLKPETHLHRGEVKGASRPVKCAAVPSLATFATCILLAASLWAGEAHLVEGHGPERVVIDAREASVDEVLAALAAHFEFAVERGGAAGSPVRFSGRLQGSLDEVLERLLRHHGHMIVRSQEARGGIGRIVLIDAKRGTLPAPVSGPIAAIKAKIKEKEEAGQ